MAMIAAEAGVGIGALYRHFPTRGQLLSYLTHWSFEQPLTNARAAEQTGPTAIAALRCFIESAIEQRNDLVLPLHGGPPVTASSTRTVRTKVHRAIDAMIERGRHDGTVTREVTAGDIITFGAMLAQPRQADPSWTTTSGRLLNTYLKRLGTGG
jgi:AcrR family transcriptional regulator